MPEAAAEKSTGGSPYPLYRWAVLVSWMLPHTWSYIFLSSLGLLLPSMRLDMDLSPLQEGFLGSAAQLALMLLAIPLGWWLSRFSPKLISSISFFLATGLIFLYGWAPFYLLLLLCRFLLGVMSISREPSWVLIIRQWVPPNAVVIANAMANFTWGIGVLGLMLVPVVLSLLDDNWRHTTYVLGAVMLVLALVWQVIGKERETSEYKEQMQIQRINPLAILQRYKELWVLGLGMLGIGIGFSGFSVFWPSFRLEEFGMSLFSSSMAMAVGGVTSGLVGIVIGIWVSRYGWKRKLLFLTGVVMASTSIALLWGSALWLVIVLFLVQSVSWSFYPVVMTIPYELSGIRPREIAVAISTLFTMLWIGAFIGPVLSGFIQELTGDLRLAILVTSLAPLCMTLGAFLLSSRWDAPPHLVRSLA